MREGGAISNSHEDVQQSANDEIEQLRNRAERAEAEVARLRHHESEQTVHSETASSDEGASSREGHSSKRMLTSAQSASTGEDELRQDSMMAHLMDSLRSGQNIGHYGRLVFAMVARHFLDDEELVRWLTRDPDFQEAEAVNLVRQVEGRDYNPPKRERILEWQAQQDFPIIPNIDDPDSGNLYRNLKFPDSIYENIEEYQEKKVAAEG